MSAVEDMRTVLQDFLTPELRALQERLTGIEKTVNTRIDGLDKRIDGIDRRLDSLEKRIDDFRVEVKEAMAESRGELRGEMRAHADSLHGDIRAGISHIVSQLQLDARLGKLEEENQRKKLLPDQQ